MSCSEILNSSKKELTRCKELQAKLDMYQCLLDEIKLERDTLRNELSDMADNVFMTAKKMINEAERSKDLAEKKLLEANNMMEVLKSESNFLKRLISELGLSDATRKKSQESNHEYSQKLNHHIILKEGFRFHPIQFRLFKTILEKCGENRNENDYIQTFVESEVNQLVYQSRNQIDAKAIATQLVTCQPIVEMLSKIDIQRRCYFTGTLGECSHRLKISESDENMILSNDDKGINDWIYVSQIVCEQILSINQIVTFLKQLHELKNKIPEPQLLFQYCLKKLQLESVKLGISLDLSNFQTTF